MAIIPSFIDSSIALRSRYSAAISFGSKPSVSLRMLRAKRIPPTIPASNTAKEKRIISFVLLNMLDSIPLLKTLLSQHLRLDHSLRYEQ